MPSLQADITDMWHMADSLRRSQFPRTHSLRAIPEMWPCMECFVVMAEPSLEHGKEHKTKALVHIPV